MNVQQELTRGRVLRRFLYSDCEERHVLALQSQRAISNSLCGPREEAPRARPPLPRAQRAQRARENSKERRAAPPTSIRSVRSPLLFNFGRVRESRRRSTTTSTNSSSTSAPKRATRSNRIWSTSTRSSIPFAHPSSRTGVSTDVAPADRFFTYKHFLDGNGELIDPNVMRIIAKCMIRNKPDSYCQAHDVDTRGVSDLVQRSDRPLHFVRRAPERQAAAALAHGQRTTRAAGAGMTRFRNRLRWFFASMFRRKK